MARIYYIICIALLLGSSASAQAPLTKLTWYVDTDPGRDKADSISFPLGTLDTALDYTFPLAALGLKPGIHFLYLRAKDNSGEWSLTHSFPFMMAFNGPANVAKIDYAEYSFDNLAPRGTGVPIPLTSAATVDTLFTAAIDSLPNGIHTLFVRAKDEYGNWSLPISKTFLKQNTSVLDTTDLVSLEYFFDVDPGFGKGTSVPFTSTSEIDTTFVADLSTLSKGLHTIYIRAQDEYSNWSMVSYKTFLKQGSGVGPGSRDKITTILYTWYDSISGDVILPSDRKYTSFTPDTNVSIVFIPYACLDSGTYWLEVVGVDSSGNRSIPYRHLVHIDSATGPPGSNNVLHDSIYTFNFGSDTLAAIDSIFSYAGEPALKYEVTLLAGNLTVDTAGGFIVISSIQDAVGEDTLVVRAQDSCGNVAYDTAYLSVVGAPFDVALLSLVSPNSGCTLGASESISISIQNLGTDTASGFTLSYTLGGDTVSQLFSMKLIPGAVDTFTFDSTVNLSVTSTYSFGFWVEWVKDVVDENDSLLGSSLTRYQTLLVQADEDTSICEGETVTLSVLSNYTTATYLWSNGATTSSITVTPSATTTYQVTGTSPQGCTTTDSVLVTVNQLPATPSIVSSGGDTLPFGTTSTGTITGLVGTPTWTFPNATTSSNDTISLEKAGTYTLSQLDTITGCYSGLDTLVLAIEDSTYIRSVEGFTALCKGDTLRLLVVNAETVNWSGSSSMDTITVVPSVDTTIYATGTTPFGFSYSDSFKIAVNPAVIPSSFSTVLPEDGKLGIQPCTSINYNWSPSTNANLYDLYVWKHGSSRGAPVVTGISGLNTSHSNCAFYTHSDTFLWQVRSYNTCFSNWSDTATFQTRVPADLTVSNISSSDTAYQRQTASIQWKVKNVGSASTGSNTWKDYIYLSPDSTFSSSTAIYIGQKDNVAFLQPNQGYTSSLNFSVATSLVGSYWTFVQTNANGGAYEANTANNMVRGDRIYVIEPTTPDLEMISFSSSSLAFAGDTVTISYCVKNTGDAEIVESFYDAFYLDDDSTINISGNTGSAVTGGIRLPIISSTYNGTTVNYTLGSQYSILSNFNDTLWQDSQYCRVVKVVLPHCIRNRNYIHAFTDDDNRIFETANTNNTNLYFPVDVFARPFPDLVVSKVQAPDSGKSNQSLSISWTDSNQGFNKPYHYFENNWNDRAYISSSSMSPTNLTQIGAAVHFNTSSFTPGTIASKSISWTVPATMPTGTYYFWINADASDQICELDSNSNNWRRSEPIGIKYIPPPPAYADLRITTFSAPDTIRTTSPFAVSWTTENQGISPAAPPIIDRLFIRDDASATTQAGWSSAYCKVQAGGFTRTTSIAAGTSYNSSGSGSIPLPSCLEPGAYWLTMAPDYTIPNTSDINSKVQQVYFDYNDDLAIDTAIAPSISCNARSINVQWTVTNYGDYMTKANRWIDKVYLSTDTIIGGDLASTQFTRSGYLNKNSTYNGAATLQAPNGCSGNYYIIVSTGDNHPGNYCCSYGTLWDKKKSNNTFFIPITLSQCDTVDLSAILLAPDTILAGRTTVISFNLLNSGSDSTRNSSFYNSAYINDRPGISGADRVGIKLNNSYLPPNSNTASSIDVTVPSFISGYYYLALAVDKAGRTSSNYYAYNIGFCQDTLSGNIYEHGAGKEGNNVVSKLVYIAAPKPSDLIVSSLSTASTAELGTDLSFTYSVKNIGPNAAVGVLNTGFFFSDDSLYSGLTDNLHIADDRGISLQPGDSFIATTSAQITNVNPGFWNPLANTDLLNQFFESDETNNVTVADSIEITITPLPLATNQSFGLYQGDLVYRKLSPGADKDIRISLTSNKASGENEVYVSKGKVPTSFDFDFIYTNQLSPNQEILIPDTDGDDYFIMVRTRTNFSGTHTVTLRADTLPFGLLTHQYDTVGQGRVTAELTGARFDTGLTVWLEVDGQPVYAELREIRSRVRADIRWRLHTVPVGTYTIYATKPGFDTVALPNGLTVVPSSGLQVDFASIVPPTVRCNSKAYFIYYMTNTGNVDIPQWDIQFFVPDLLGNMITTSTALKKNTDFSTPSAMSSDNYLENGQTNVIPLLARDVRPGQILQANFYLGRFPNANNTDIPIAWKQFPTYERWSVDRAYLEVERVLTAILTNSSEFPSSALAAASSSQTLQDTLFAFWQEEGLIDTLWLDRETLPVNQPNVTLNQPPLCGNTGLF